MVGVQLPEHKVCDPDTFTQAGNWKDCGTKGWPATGWAKDYTMNYGNPATFASAEHSDAKAFFEKKMSVFGGEQYRPLLHVKDVARAIEVAIKSKKRGIYNLSYKNMKIIDIANEIKKYFKNTKIIKTKIKFQDARNYKVKNNKAYKELSFKAKYDLKYGINELKKLLNEKRIKNFNDPRYTNQKYLEIFKESI